MDTVSPSAASPSDGSPSHGAPVPGLGGVDAYVGSVAGVTSTAAEAECPCACGRVIVDTGTYLLPLTARVHAVAVRLATDVRRMVDDDAPAAHQERVDALMAETLELRGQLVEWCHGRRELAFGRHLHEWGLRWGRSFEAHEQWIAATGYRLARAPVPPPPPPALGDPADPTDPGDPDEARREAGRSVPGHHSPVSAD